VKRMKEKSLGKKVDQFLEICESENLVVDSPIYLEPVERFQNRSNVTKFRSFGDSTSSMVMDNECSKLFGIYEQKPKTMTIGRKYEDINILP